MGAYLNLSPTFLPLLSLSKLLLHWLQQIQNKQQTAPREMTVSKATKKAQERLKKTNLDIHVRNNLPLCSRSFIHSRDIIEPSERETV